MLWSDCGGIILISSKLLRVPRTRKKEKKKSNGKAHFAYFGQYCVDIILNNAPLFFPSSVDPSSPEFILEHRLTERRELRGALRRLWDSSGEECLFYFCMLSFPIHCEN